MPSESDETFYIGQIDITLSTLRMVKDTDPVGVKERLQSRVDDLRAKLKAITDCRKIKMEWTRIPGDQISADLSTSGHYVVSHRPEQHNVSYRPPGEHHHIGTFNTPEAAFLAAAAHSATV